MQARTLAPLLAVPMLMVGLAAAAQTPEGRWKTIDDDTGKVKSIVEIARMGDGTLQGKVVQVLQSDKGPDPKCDACECAN